MNEVWRQLQSSKAPLSEGNIKGFTYQHRLLGLNGGLLGDAGLVEGDIKNVLDGGVGGEEVFQLLAVVHLHVLHQPAGARALLPEPKEPEVNHVDGAHLLLVLHRGSSLHMLDS